MDNGNPTRKDGAQTPSTTLQLIITLDQMTGAVNVTGPINNALVCYGMLESAKDCIRQYIKDNQGRIIPANGMRIVGN